MSALADFVLVLHLGFIIFVVAGALLVLRWPRLAWLHLPLAAWGVIVGWGNFTCPLTPLENYFRRRAGESGYSEGFIEHYLTAVIYPDGLTRTVQLGLGLGVLLVNLILYWHIYRTLKQQRAS
ncbi:MAG: DUF2784 domain-containing protein [Gemmatimonadales bacterium]